MGEEGEGRTEVVVVAVRAAGDAFGVDADACEGAKEKVEAYAGQRACDEGVVVE